VVSNIFYFHPETWGRRTHFDSYFSDGLKPPTSYHIEKNPFCQALGLVGMLGPCRWVFIPRHGMAPGTPPPLPLGYFFWPSVFFCEIRPVGCHTSKNGNIFYEWLVFMVFM